MFLKKQKPTSELKIILNNGQEFTLTTIKPTSTLFEVKQCIENLKSIKIDQQILSLPLNKQLILNDEKTLVDSGLFQSNTQNAENNALKLTLNTNPIRLHINLSHSLQKYGSFVNKQSFQIDTSGGSATVANSDEIEIKTFPSCSIYCLKYLLSKQLQTPIQDQVLTYQGQTLENQLSLFNYLIVEQSQTTHNTNQSNGAKLNINTSMKQSCTGDDNHSASNSSGSDIREYELNLIIMKKKKKVVPLLNLNQSQANMSNTNSDLSSSFQLSLGIDFTFNTIKNVKKVNWKEDAPWYREITDGLSWICYCQNEKCVAFKQMVVINKGYGVFSIKKEMLGIKCPCCLTGKFLEVRNCGFVNCEWAMRGILNRNKESKIYADGKTYDNKLYTFKECDYKSIWFALDIMVKHLDAKNSLKNIPSAREDKKKNNMMIDKALEQEGIPIPNTKKKSNIDEDESDYNSEDEDEELKDDVQPGGGIQNPIQNIQILPSNRGPKGAFCCTDNGVAVQCSLVGGNKNKQYNSVPNPSSQQQTQEDQQKQSSMYKKRNGRGGGHHHYTEGGISSSTQSQPTQFKWVPKTQKSEEPSNTAAEPKNEQIQEKQNYEQTSQLNIRSEEFSKKGKSSYNQNQEYKRYDQQETSYRGGRGRGGYQKNETQSRGGRGRGRGGYQKRQYDDNQSYQMSDAQYFEERKAEREMFEGRVEPQVNAKQFNQQEEYKINSRKMDYNKDKVRMTRNLGSTANYLGDYDESNKFIPKDEKVTYINEQEERERRAAKEKASVKYNYQDFLNQFQNLTEQCVYLVETLSKGTQECIICHNPIYQRSALWNCNQCHQPFHLGCIKRWIKKLNNQDDEEEEKKQPEIRSARRDQQGYEEDKQEEESEARKAAKKLLAFYSWTCPNCNFAYTENQMPRYFCFCRRYDEPGYSPMILPHSCGEYCDRKKHDHCTHGKCDVLCHPGSCPPCNINVPVRCFCGKEQKRVPCSVSQRSQFSCENSCGRLLNCLIHTCQQQCHQGPCEKCDKDIVQKCYCEKEERTVKCGSKRFICNKICGKTLDCGKHQCQKVCHEGACQPCQKVPSRMKYCPCGRREIRALLGKDRKECTDKIPVCQGTCEKFLPCGRHQCTMRCHNDDCMKCEELVEQLCSCGKDRRMVPCYQVNYPDHLRQQMMTPQQLEEIDNFKCKKVCGQLQSCKKHKCKELCCPVKKGVSDPMGRHLCLRTCNKTLSCGKHQCNSFCHLGFCKPCRYVSTQPLYCPCATTKVDPPIRCDTQQPTCSNPCKNVLPCGHKCTLKCHTGNCPPCLEVVTKVCNCGSEIAPNVYCNQKKHSCGKVCNQPLPCGHLCQKICHPPGQCFTSEDELMKNGCGERCNQPRKNCKHRCTELCHPLKECPENPCEAEIRVYCKCGFRYVYTLCKSIAEREPIECNSECWKHQREIKLALAFGSPKDFEANKDSIKLEYYPEEVLEFARDHPKFVEKCEKLLTDVVLEKSTRSFTGLTSGKKSFLSTLVFEHFKLDMCTYGNKNSKTVTDVFWKEGSKVPDVLVSEVMTLIERGIMSANNDDNRSQVFEATLYIYNVQKGTTIDDLKKFLNNFRNEMYTQKGKQQGQFYVHFYKKMRAKDALTYIKNTPNQFTNVEMIMHKKEIGTNPDAPSQGQSAQEAKKKQKRERVIDDEGFTMIK